MEVVSDDHVHVVAVKQVDCLVDRRALIEDRPQCNCDDDIVLALVLVEFLFVQHQDRHAQALLIDAVTCEVRREPHSDLSVRVVGRHRSALAREPHEAEIGKSDRCVTVPRVSVDHEAVSLREIVVARENMMTLFRHARKRRASERSHTSEHRRHAVEQFLVAPRHELIVCTDVSCQELIELIVVGAVHLIESLVDLLDRQQCRNVLEEDQSDDYRYQHDYADDDERDLEAYFGFLLCLLILCHSDSRPHVSLWEHYTTWEGGGFRELGKQKEPPPKGSGSIFMGGERKI